MADAGVYLSGRLLCGAHDFAYNGKVYSYGEVKHVDRWQRIRRRTGHNGRPEVTYDASLALVFNDNSRVFLSPQPWWRVWAPRDKPYYDKVLEAGEAMAARTFNPRMDGYAARMREKKYVSWGPYQITLSGELYYNFGYCLNLRGADVRCYLYPLRLVCVTRPKQLWKRLIYNFIKIDEIIDLTRDRDCFLTLLHTFLNITWPGETLRPWMNAPRAAGGGAASAGGGGGAAGARQQGGSGRQDGEAAGGTRREAPPRAKVMPSSVQYLAVLSLHEGADWDAVRASYRKLVKLHHPDLVRGRGASAATVAEAEDTLKRLNEAYAWLEDFYRTKPK